MVPEYFDDVDQIGLRLGPRELERRGRGMGWNEPTLERPELALPSRRRYVSYHSGSGVADVKILSGSKRFLARCSRARLLP